MIQSGEEGAVAGHEHPHDALVFQKQDVRCSPDPRVQIPTFTQVLLLLYFEVHVQSVERTPSEVLVAKNVVHHFPVQDALSEK